MLGGEHFFAASADVKHRRLFFGVVRGADEWAGFAGTEANTEGVFFPLGKFFRRHPTIDWLMLFAGLQVLADRQHIDADCLHILEYLFDLFILLTDAEHDAGFGGKAARLGMFEYP